MGEGGETSCGEGQGVVDRLGGEHGDEGGLLPDYCLQRFFVISRVDTFFNTGAYRKTQIANRKISPTNTIFCVNV